MKTAEALRKARLALREAEDELRDAEERVEECECEIEALQARFNQEQRIERQLRLTGIVMGWSALCDQILTECHFLSGAEIEAVEDLASGRYDDWEDDRRYLGRNAISPRERCEERVLFIARHHGLNLKEFDLEEIAFPADQTLPLPLLAA